MLMERSLGIFLSDDLFYVLGEDKLNEKCTNRFDRVWREC